MSTPSCLSDLTWERNPVLGPPLLLPEQPLNFGSVPKMGTERVVTLKEHMQVPVRTYVWPVPGVGQSVTACHPSVPPAGPVLRGPRLCFSISLLAPSTPLFQTCHPNPSRVKEPTEMAGALKTHLEP